MCSNKGGIDDARGIVDALAVTVGPLAARVLLSLGFIGGSLCAALVVGLAVAWGICEAFDAHETLSQRHDSELIKENTPFYACFAGVVLLCSALGGLGLR